MTTLKDYYDGWGETPEENQDQLADTARWIRNCALKETDWTQFNDVPLSEESKSIWANYRNELRNLDFANINPETFTFPSKPQ